MRFLTSTVLMSIFVAVSVMFTSCSDEDLSIGGSGAPEGADTALLEAYGLTFENFITENDVQILNADTTEISVSKALADKLGIESFVGHPLGIWHEMSQLPYARKAVAEKLAGDRYILTVKPASVAEMVGDKKVTLNTGLYVNPNAQDGGVTRADGLDMPGYAAKYMDGDNVIHPAVILLTGGYDYDKGYHVEGEQPVADTRSASDGYEYMTAEELLGEQTRASVRSRILSFNDELEIDKNFQCGDDEEDSINVNFKAPLDFELNYFITLDGAVKWHFVIPEPYVDRFEAGIDGKFAFSPELKIGFKKEWKLDEDKFKKTIATFNAYTFTFWVGPVPVCIKCEPEMFLKIDGKVTGAVHVGLKYEYENNFRGGIRYTDSNGWSTINEFNEVKNDLTFIRPEAQVKAEAGIGMYLGMNVMIYGVAGPEVAVGPRLGAEAELTLSPFAENYDEMLDFKAEVGLTMNAVVGAKLKVLGYELAEYTRTIRLAGPWTLWKYPSDGSEHKAGQSEEERQFNMYEVVWLKKDIVYAAQCKSIVEKLTEMRGISEDEAHEIIRKMCIEAIKKVYGELVNSVNDATECLREYIMGDLQREYADYEFQKHAEQGDTEWCNAKNWDNIQLMLNKNYDIHSTQQIFEEVHKLFVKTFGREPNISKEDLHWLADHIVNYEKYAQERLDRKTADMDIIIANIEKRYASYKAEYPRLFNQALSDIDHTFTKTYGCAPTPDDSRVYKLFESMLKELIDQYKANKEQAKARDWNTVSQLLKAELSNYFNYSPRNSQRMLNRAREWFYSTYRHDPSNSKEDMDIMIGKFKELMKENFNIVL